MRGLEVWKRDFPFQIVVIFSSQPVSLGWVGGGRICWHVFCFMFFIYDNHVFLLMDLRWQGPLSSTFQVVERNKLQVLLMVQTSGSGEPVAAEVVNIQLYVLCWFTSQVIQDFFHQQMHPRKLTWNLNMGVKKEMPFGNHHFQDPS